MMGTPFDEFLQQAWADHADRPLAVAERLQRETPAPQSAAQLSALMRLTTHLLGEHLGRFADARWRLQALATHPLAGDAVQSDLRVALATLNLAEGKADATAGLNDAECMRAEAAAAAMCIGRGQSERAMALIASARRRLAALPNTSAADHRPLAAACHNMAWELHDKGAQRSAAETAAMLELAAASREHWSHAGTWLEVERGDYDLACTHLSAGLHDEALRHAARCLAACITHDAPPFEHFFGHEVLARIQHARGDAAAAAHHAAAARQAFDRLEPDDQAACRASLDKIAAWIPAAS